MASGTGSTLELHPEGLSTIVFDLREQTEPYMVNLGSLNLNESARLAVQYGEAVTGEGGHVAGARGPLVPVTFSVVVSGSTRQQMIQYAQELKHAVCNERGGTLKYKPEDVPGSAEDTYYHYLRSGPPALAGKRGNRWDSGAHDDGYYRVVVQVEVMTQPFATSDPDNLVQFLYETSIHNEDGEDAYHAGNPNVVRRNYVTVDSSYIKGDAPALTRMQVMPRTDLASAGLGKLYWARRLGGLASFRAMYNDGVGIDGADWEDVVDGNRSGGGYQRMAPPSLMNNLDQGLRYTVDNWDDHRGRAAIAAIVRDNTDGDDPTWRLRSSWTVGDTKVYTSYKQVPETRFWRILILGEMEIPATEMSDIEQLSLYVDVYVKRLSGAESIEIDAMVLVFLDEEGGIEGYAQEVMAAGTGVEYSKQLLVENVENEICHVVNPYYYDHLVGLAVAHGPFLRLVPGQDNRVDVLWERPETSFVLEDDDFGGYYNRHDVLAVFDDNVETITFDAPVDQHIVENQRIEGRSSLKIDDTDAWVKIALDPPLDMIWYFGYDSATMSLWGFCTGTNKQLFVEIRLCTTSSDYYWLDTFEFTSFVSWGWSEAYKYFPQFENNVVGSPNRREINEIWIRRKPGGATNPTHFYLDYLVAEKEWVPTNESNPTWNKWDYYGSTSPARFHIVTEQDEASAMMMVPAVRKAYETPITIVEEPVVDDVRIWGRAKAKYQDGRVGLFVRGTNCLRDNEDLYAFYISTEMDRAYLMSYSAGTPTDIGGRCVYPSSHDHMYYLGLEVIGDNLRAYAGETEDVLFTEAAKLFDVEDATHTTGRAGVYTAKDTTSDYMSARYDDVSLQQIQDKHVPSDSVLVEITGLHRTTYPFCE